MSTRPTTLPQWATDGGADVVEPSGAQKGDGWDVNDRLVTGWTNWLFLTIHRWVEHFADGVLWQMGDSFIGSAANSILARVKMPARAQGTSAIDRTLVLESAGFDNTVRLYRTSNSGFELYEWAFNCKVDASANWTCDNTSKPAHLHRSQGQEIMVLRHSATASSWTDAAWTATDYDLQVPGGGNNKLILDDGSFEFGTVSTHSNPSSSTSIANKVLAKNQVKAWAALSTDGSGNVTVLDGFNITSVTINGSNDLEVNIGADFDNTDHYAPVATNGTFANRLWSAPRISAGQFQLRAFQADTNTQINLSTTAAKVHVIVCGTQA